MKNNNFLSKAKPALVGLALAAALAFSGIASAKAVFSLRLNTDSSACYLCHFSSNGFTAWLGTAPGSYPFKLSPSSTAQPYGTVFSGTDGNSGDYTTMGPGGPAPVPGNVMGASFKYSMSNVCQGNGILNFTVTSYNASTKTVYLSGSATIHVSSTSSGQKSCSVSQP